MVKKIGIIGLGNVGEATVKSLVKYSSAISRRTSLKLGIKGVCDAKSEKKNIAAKFSIPFTSNADKLINDPEIDIIVELIGGIEPAHSFIKKALKNGKDVVTANKALLATYGRDIFSLAKKKKRAIGFEASVGGAIPIIKSVSEGLVSCDVKKIYAILNGTTNYILYRMDKEKLDFSSVLKEAQDKGLAEKNPYLDIEGIDALHKLSILSYLCFGIWPSLKKVYTEGISKVSLADILYAKELGYKIKLLAIAKKEKDKLDLRVHPTFISAEHPLSDVSMAFNAVYLQTQPAEELLLYGKGAGGAPTSSAVISDIVNIALGGKGFIRREEKVELKNVKDNKSRYYMRLMVKDRPGVLAHIAEILASFNISIASVNQKDRGEDKFVPIVMVSHEAREDNVKKALLKIDKLSVVRKPSQIIRIEDL